MSTKFNRHILSGLSYKRNKTNATSIFTRCQTAGKGILLLLAKWSGKACGAVFLIYALIILLPILILVAGVQALALNLKRRETKPHPTKTSGSANCSRQAIVLQFPTPGKLRQHGQDYTSLENLTPTDAKSLAVDKFLDELKALQYQEEVTGEIDYKTLFSIAECVNNNQKTSIIYLDPHNRRKRHEQ